MGARAAAGSAPILGSSSSTMSPTTAPFSPADSKDGNFDVVEAEGGLRAL
jgi:hypothetical protein